LVYNMLFTDVQGYQENKIWVKQIPSSGCPCQESLYLCAGIPI
jgi:hypothetical protein